MKLKNILKHLPSLGMGAGQVIFLTYLLGSGINETLNPLKWGEKRQERKKQTEYYQMLYNKVFNYADKDGIKGLNLDELYDLYERVGINLNINQSKLGRAIYLPRLTTNDLEKAVKSYESEINEGKEK